MQKRLQRTPSGLYIPSDNNMPSVEVQNDPWDYYLWSDSPIDTLGRRGSASDLTVSQMMEMWNDEVIGILMSYLAALLVGGEYEIVCSDPAKKLFFEAMYGEIHRPLMLRSSPALFFGFQGLVKVFDFTVPSPLNMEMAKTPVWGGSGDPLILKEVQQIHPRLGRPKLGRHNAFEGIDPGNGQPVIPPMYALWMTVGKWKSFGNLMGKGRATTCYHPWWSKYFTLEQRALYVQRGIDPIPVVRHPPGVNEDTGIDYSVYAHNIGDAVRAGMSVALPSDTYANVTGGGFTEAYVSTPKWNLEYLINTADVAPFSEIKNDEDRRIAMGMLVPSQAILEAQTYGLGGPNTAEVLGEMAERVLIQDAEDIDRHINKYIFPLISSANFGHDSPPVYKITKGLNAIQRSHLTGILELLLGLPDVDTTIFDVKSMAERLDIPLQESTKATDLTTTGGQTIAAAQPQNVAQETEIVGDGRRAESTTPSGSAGSTPQPQIIRQSVEGNFFKDFPRLTDALYDQRLADRHDNHTRRFAKKRGVFSWFNGMRFAGSEEFERAMDEVRDEAESEMQAVLNRWTTGALSSDQVVRDWREILAGYVNESVQLGKREKGDTELITSAEREKADEWLKFQEEKLDGIYTIMREAENGDISETAEMLATFRLPLYANALRGEYERQRARFDISRWPRSGGTKCLMGCKCSLTWGTDADGPYVEWTLGAPEKSCSDCPELASRGKMREGEL